MSYILKIKFSKIWNWNHSEDPFHLVEQFNFSCITNYSSFEKARKILLFNSVQHFKSISVIKNFSKIYEWILRLLITVTCLAFNNCDLFVQMWCD